MIDKLLHININEDINDLYILSYKPFKYNLNLQANTGLSGISGFSGAIGPDASQLTFDNSENTIYYVTFI